MGVKGDKMTKGSQISMEWLTEQLALIEEVTVEKMFGGDGIFHDKTIFGIVDSKGQCFEIVDNAIKEKLMAAGAIHHSKMPYYSMPDTAIDNQIALLSIVQPALTDSK